MSIAAIILQCLLIFAFVVSGLGKIAGAKMQVDTFRHLKLSQGFRIVTGFTQLIGAAGLIIGFWNEAVLSLAALWIACIMLGAVLFHMRVRDPLGKMIGALVLLACALVVGFYHLSALSELL